MWKRVCDSIKKVILKSIHSSENVTEHEPHIYELIRTIP